MLRENSFENVAQIFKKWPCVHKTAFTKKVQKKLKQKKT